MIAVVQPACKARSRSAAGPVANRRPLEERHRELLSPRVDGDLRPVRARRELLQRFGGLLEAARGLRHRRVRLDLEPAYRIARDIEETDLRAGTVDDAFPIGRRKADVVFVLVRVAAD